MKTIQKRSIIICVLTVLMTMLPASSGLAQESNTTFRIALMPKSGQPLGIVPPNEFGVGGGFKSNLYTLKKEHLTGEFTTNILSATNIGAVLGGLTSPGAYVSVDSVEGRFNTSFGTIVDMHSPTIVVLHEDPTLFDYGLVMVAVAQGQIVDGTMAFKDATGTTSLYLKFEVDGVTKETVIIAGSFVIEID